MMRMAAATLLLLMVFDIGADVLYGETGDFLLAMPISSHSQATFTSVAADGQNSSSDSIHECFCCCSHLEQEVPSTFHVSLNISQSSVRISTPLPDPDPVHIYHPPLHFA